MTAWYVINTLTRQEARAQLNLRQQGYRTWLPTIARTRRHAHRIDEINAPLFPGYLFVELDLSWQAWSPINGTYGVRALVANGGQPNALPSAFISGLRELASPDGTIRQPEPMLQVGQQVRIISGPFSDCLASVVGLNADGRVRVLLNVLNGSVKATISRWAVQSAA